MKIFAAIVLSAVIQAAASGNDRAAASVDGNARRFLRTRGEQRLASERRQTMREEHKAQLHELRAEAKKQAVPTTRQELYQSIQGAKIQAREQARKLIDEERALIRTGA